MKVPGRRSRRLPWLIGGAVLLVAAAVAGTLILLHRGDSAQSGKVIAQYHYTFTVPVDWAQTGGRPEFRETLIKPADQPKGDDAIVVQEASLTIDATADRARWVNSLKGEVASQGSQYSGFNAEAGFAGREVVYYRQAGQAGTIDWYAFAAGNVQVNIGCQYATQAGRDRVAAACEQVVRGVQIAP